MLSKHGNVHYLLLNGNRHIFWIFRINISKYDVFVRKILSKSLLQATTFRTNLLKTCGSPDLLPKPLIMELFKILKSSKKKILVAIPELCEDLSLMIGNSGNSENLFKTREQRPIFNFFRVSFSSSYNCSAAGRLSSLSVHFI